MKNKKNNQKGAVKVKKTKLAVSKVVSMEAKLSANCPRSSQNVCGINYRMT